MSLCLDTPFSRRQRLTYPGSHPAEWASTETSGGVFPSLSTPPTRFTASCENPLAKKDIRYEVPSICSWVGPACEKAPAVKKPGKASFGCKDERQSRGASEPTDQQSPAKRILGEDAKGEEEWCHEKKIEGRRDDNVGV